MTTLHEYSRKYIFPLDENGLKRELVVNMVKHIIVSDSGSHRLTTWQGTLVYVPAGWIGIEIESPFGWEL